MFIYSLSFTLNSASRQTTMSAVWNFIAAFNECVKVHTNQVCSAAVCVSIVFTVSFGCVDIEQQRVGSV